MMHQQVHGVYVLKRVLPKGSNISRRKTMAHKTIDHDETVKQPECPATFYRQQQSMRRTDATGQRVVASTSLSQEVRSSRRITEDRQGCVPVVISGNKNKILIGNCHDSPAGMEYYHSTTLKYPAEEDSFQFPSLTVGLTNVFGSTNTISLISFNIISTAQRRLIARAP